jgi:DNA-binding MarR family transcriptional regulator
MFVMALTVIFQETIHKKTTWRQNMEQHDWVDRHVEFWAREHDWLDPLTEEVIARIGILARHTTQVRKRTLAGDGLKLHQFKILLSLRRVGSPYATSPSSLAESLGLTRGALSARLGPLEEAGLLTRTHDAQDRRRVEVRLTDAGYRAYEQHAMAESRGEGDLLAPLTPAERRTLADLLRKLVVAAN